jgi:hypothetical protein
LPWPCIRYRNFLNLERIQHRHFVLPVTWDEKRVTFYLLFAWVWNLVSHTKGRTTWGCLRTGCWGECLDLKGRK